LNLIDLATELAPTRRALFSLFRTTEIRKNTGADHAQVSRPAIAPSAATALPPGGRTGARGVAFWDAAHAVFPFSSESKRPPEGGLHGNARPSFTRPGAILRMSFRQLHELRKERKKK